jgi:hypothetical protein
MVKPMEVQDKHDSPWRIVRAAILNGVAIPATAIAQLEARGVDVGELENRIRQQFEWRH